MSSAATASYPVTVLWMDDEPDSINDYREMLEKERGHQYLRIDIATSIREARERLATGAYAGLVVDLNLDRYSPEENGAKFLRQINEEQKYFPTFVFSGYLKESRFTRYLNESHPIKTVDKSETSIERPIADHWFIKAIREAGKNYLEVKDLRPEWITYKDFIKNPGKFAEQTSKHWKKHGHWINVKMGTEKWVWVVVCGDNVVAGSNDLFDYPDDERLMAYGVEYNLVPFPYSKPSLPEDLNVRLTNGLGWNPTSYQNDYYPAFLASIDDTEITDDFDTGAQHTFVSDELVSLGLFDRWRNYDIPHLGQEFEHITRKINLTIVDDNGRKLSRKISVVVIKNWRESSFIHVNDKRKVLFGRDILRAFDLEVSLNSQQRITRIRFL